MNRMWEIREHDGFGKMGRRSDMRSPEVEEAYECGYEEGYREAMMETHSYYGERGSSGMRSYRGGGGGR